MLKLDNKSSHFFKSKRKMRMVMGRRMKAMKIAFLSPASHFGDIEQPGTRFLRLRWS